MKDNNDHCTVRPAVEADLEQIFQIYRYYVLYSTISLLLNEPAQSYISTRFHGTVARNLPYLVAVQQSQPTQKNAQLNTSSSNHDSTTREKVLGFAHAYPFNAGRSGYATSIELTLYLHPACTAQGIGTTLMSNLLDQLKGQRCLAWEENTTAKATKQEFTIRNVYAVMSSDVAPTPEWKMENQGQQKMKGWPEWEAKGERTRDWYVEKFGFQEVGRLNGAGWKFGRATNLIYLEKKL